MNLILLNCSKTSNKTKLNFVIQDNILLKFTIIWLKVGKCSLELAGADLIPGCKKWATLLPTFKIYLKIL